MKIIGVTASKFTGKDGNLVSGYKFFMTYPLSSGTGDGATHAFVTDQKIGAWEEFPEVGDEVSVVYNRFGKIAEMRVQK